MTPRNQATVIVRGKPSDIVGEPADPSLAVYTDDQGWVRVMIDGKATTIRIVDIVSAIRAVESAQQGGTT